MLQPFDTLIFKRDSNTAMQGYREVVLVLPTVTSGSNYDSFSDGPYDITGTGHSTATYATYRAHARIKIIQDTTLAQMHQAVPGLEVGDYLLYFSYLDQPVLQKMVDNQDAYMYIDGNVFRHQNISLNGVGQAFDVYCHAKRYAAKFRATGL